LQCLNSASLPALSLLQVTIKETRRFAGKDIEVAVQVDKDSKEAQKAAEKSSSKAAASGLDAFLQEVEKKKKVGAGKAGVKGGVLCCFIFIDSVQGVSIF
jgi:hypothetical protein